MKKRLFAAFFLLGAFFASFIVAAWRLLHLAGLNPWLALLPGSAVLLWISAFAARFAARWMTRPLTELDLQHPEDATVPEEMSPLLLRVARQNREVRSQIDALEARRDELDALMEGMQEGFIALDTQENIIVINPSACAMLGTDEAFPSPQGHRTKSSTAPSTPHPSFRRLLPLPRALSSAIWITIGSRTVKAGSSSA